MTDITTLISLTPASSELDELTADVVQMAEGIKSTAEKAKAENDLVKIKQLRDFLRGGSKQSRFNEKIKYAIWSAGTLLGLILGLIIANIVGPLLEDVKSLTESVSWIKLLIVVVLGGLGWFFASLITDKRR